MTSPQRKVKSERTASPLGLVPSSSSAPRSHAPPRAAPIDVEEEALVYDEKCKKRKRSSDGKKQEKFTLTYSFARPLTTVDFVDLNAVIRHNVRRMKKVSNRSPNTVSYNDEYLTNNPRVTISATAISFKCTTDAQFKEIHSTAYPEALATLIACGAPSSTCASTWAYSKNTNKANEVPQQSIDQSNGIIWTRYETKDWVGLRDKLMHLPMTTIHSKLGEAVKWEHPYRIYQSHGNFLEYTALQSRVDAICVYEQGSVCLETRDPAGFANPTVEKMHAEMLLMAVSKGVDLSQQYSMFKFNIPGARIAKLMGYYTRAKCDNLLVRGQLQVDHSFNRHPAKMVVHVDGSVVVRYKLCQGTETTDMTRMIQSVVTCESGAASDASMTKEDVYQRCLATALAQKPILPSSTGEIEGLRREIALSAARAMQARADGKEDALRCIKCKAKAKEMLFLPCNHVCACEGCAKSIYTGLRPTCPSCQSPVDGLVRCKIVSD